MQDPFACQRPPLLLWDGVAPLEWERPRRLPARSSVLGVSAILLPCRVTVQEGYATAESTQGRAWDPDGAAVRAFQPNQCEKWLSIPQGIFSDAGNRGFLSRHHGT